MKTKNKAFTLAEIMIVLLVIGVLSAIILPAAMNSSPNENIMKFKKSNAMLSKVIEELISSDKFYKDGNLGKDANGNDVNAKYLCQTMADILTTKSSSCNSGPSAYSQINYYASFDKTSWEASNINIKQTIDTACSTAQGQAYRSKNGLIETSDKVSYYDPAPGSHFAIKYSDYLSSGDNRKYFSEFREDDFQYNPIRIYKIFCIDVDGLNSGEAPFGYGIRIDGKIYTGARADSWIEKSITKKN